MVHSSGPLRPTQPGHSSDDVPIFGPPSMSDRGRNKNGNEKRVRPSARHAPTGCTGGSAAGNGSSSCRVSSASPARGVARSEECGRCAALGRRCPAHYSCRPLRSTPVTVSYYYFYYYKSTDLSDTLQDRCCWALYKITEASRTTVETSEF